MKNFNNQHNNIQNRLNNLKNVPISSDYKSYSNNSSN